MSQEKVSSFSDVQEQNERLASLAKGIDFFVSGNMGQRDLSLFLTNLRAGGNDVEKIKDFCSKNRGVLSKLLPLYTSVRFSQGSNPRNTIALEILNLLVPDISKLSEMYEYVTQFLRGGMSTEKMIKLIDDFSLNQNTSQKISVLFRNDSGMYKKVVSLEKEIKEAHERKLGNAKRNELALNLCNLILEGELKYFDPTQKYLDLNTPLEGVFAGRDSKKIYNEEGGDDSVASTSTDTGVEGVYTDDMEPSSPDQVPQATPSAEATPVAPLPQETLETAPKGGSGAEGNPGVTGDGNEGTVSSADSTPGAEAQSPAETEADAVIAEEVSPEVRLFRDGAQWVQDFLLNAERSDIVEDLHAHLKRGDSFTLIARLCASDAVIRKRLEEIRSVSGARPEKGENDVLAFQIADLLLEPSNGAIETSVPPEEQGEVLNVLRQAVEGRKTEGEMFVERLRGLSSLEDNAFLRGVVKTLRSLDSDDQKDFLADVDDDFKSDLENEVVNILLRLETVKDKGASRLVESLVKKVDAKFLYGMGARKAINRNRVMVEVKRDMDDFFKGVATGHQAEKISQGVSGTLSESLEVKEDQFVALFPNNIEGSFDAVDFVTSLNNIPSVEVLTGFGENQESLRFLTTSFETKYGGVFEAVAALQTILSGFERAENTFKDGGYKDEHKDEQLKKIVAMKLLVEDCLKDLNVLASVRHPELDGIVRAFSDTEPGSLDISPGDISGGRIPSEVNPLKIFEYSYDEYRRLAERNTSVPRDLLAKIENLEANKRDKILKFVMLLSDKDVLERYLVNGDISFFEAGSLTVDVVTDDDFVARDPDFVSFVKERKYFVMGMVREHRRDYTLLSADLANIMRRADSLTGFIDRIPDISVGATDMPLQVPSAVSGVEDVSAIEKKLSVEEFCRGVDDFSERLRDVNASIEDVRGIQIAFATLVSQRGGTSQDQRVIDALVRLRDAIVGKREQIISLMKNALATGVESEDDERLLKYDEIRAVLDTFKQTVEGYVPEAVVAGAQEKKKEDGFFAKKVLRPTHAFIGRVKGLFASRKDNKIPQSEGGSQKAEPVYADDVLSRYTEDRKVVDNNLLSVSNEVVEAGKARPREATDEDIQEVISNVVKSQQVPAKQGLSTEDVSNLNIDVDPFADDDVSERKETRIKRMYEKLVVKPIDAYNNLPLSQKLAYSSLTVALMLGGFASVGATLAVFPRVAGAYRAGVMWGGYRQNRLIQKGLAGIRPEPPPYSDREREAKENMEYGAKRRAQVEGIAAGVAVFMLGTFAENIVALGSEALSSLKDYTSELFSPGSVPGASSAPMSASAPASGVLAPGSPAIAASAPEMSAPALVPEASSSAASGAPNPPTVEVGTGGLDLVEKMPINPGDTLTSVLLKDEVLRNIAGESFDRLTPQGKENLVANIVNLLGDKDNLAKVGLAHAGGVDRIFTGDTLDVEALKKLIIEESPLQTPNGKSVDLVQRALRFVPRLK